MAHAERAAVSPRGVETVPYLGDASCSPPPR